MLKEIEIKEIIESANTGLDAIKRAPIVSYDSGIKCLRIQDVSQSKQYDDWGFCEVEERNFKRFQLRKNEILIARTGASIGVNKFIEEDVNSVFNNGLIRIRTDEKKCLPKFLYYNFRTPYYNSFIESISGGTSTQPNMQINALLSFEINLPPLPEQKSITSILSSLDDKIDLLHRQNKTLEALAETLFRQWFVEEAEEGWETGKLGDYVQFVKGKKPKEALEEYSIGLAPQILIETFDTGKTLFSEPQNMVIANEKDILMVMDGASSGRAEIGFAGIVGSTIGLFKPISSFHYPLFIFYLLKARESHIREHTTGSAIPHADKALILNLDIQYPSIERVIAFENMAEIWFEKKKANRYQIRTLTRLRDALLPKLMSGEVRVTN